MKTVTNKTQGPIRRGLFRRMTALLLMVAVIAGMLTAPAYAASAEKTSVEVGSTTYLRDNSSPSLAGASIVKNSWIWQSSNPYVADIITNNAPSCQIKGMAVGTAIISCTVYVTTSRTNPITNQKELSYGQVMGSTYEVTVTESGANTNIAAGTGADTGVGGGKSTYMKTAPENLTFNLAAYGEQRVDLTISSGAPTNNLELGNSQYVWVRKSQSRSSIYKYTLTVGLMPNTSVGNYTAEIQLKTIAGGVRDRISIPITIICSHSYDSWTVVREATCTQTGKRAQNCQYCGDTRTETIPIAGHAVGTEWHSDSSQHWRECASCGGKADTASHVWDNGVVTSQASYSHEGVKTYTCMVCGAVKTESVLWTSGGTNTGQASGKRIPRTSFSSASLSGVSGKTGRNSLSTNSTGLISYSSSDPTVASVNSAGRVSFLKAGAAIITASVAETRLYQAASASYVVTVMDSGETGNFETANQPTISTAPQSSCRGIHTYDQGVVRREPTCSTSGESVYTCVLCGYVKTYWISPTFQHVYDNGVITQQPVGRWSGRITFTCIHCGRTRTRIFFQ